MNVKIKKDILIIEPDLDGALFLKKVLKTAGYNCLEAHDAAAGIASIEEHSPHLIMLDQSLNSRANNAVMSFINQSSAYSKIPLILMTATKNKKIVLGALSDGAQEFVYKPIMPQTLLQKLKKIFKTHELSGVTFKDPKRVKATFLGEIIKINELALILQSSVKFKGNTPVVLNSSFLERLGADHCQTKTTTEARVANPGVYRNEVLLRGMDEKTAQNIRKQKKT